MRSATPPGKFHDTRVCEHCRPPSEAHRPLVAGWRGSGTPNGLMSGIPGPPVWLSEPSDRAPGISVLSNKTGYAARLWRRAAAAMGGPHYAEDPRAKDQQQHADASEKHQL